MVFVNFFETVKINEIINHLYLIFHIKLRASFPFQRFRNGSNAVRFVDTKFNNGGKSAVCTDQSNVRAVQSRDDGDVSPFF